MPKIKILSADVANKIAAGEVVERPASVVKELVENAVDAGSTSIRVEVRAGGKRLIRVSDNGTGMMREDALLALERHATSKVNRIEDLDQIQTFGFRGEALASIASVSQFELLTRTADALTGTKVNVDGGVFRAVQESGCSPGTHMSVNNLFYNVPARLKFLKTDTTEMNHVTKQVTWTALAHPNVQFSLTHNTKSILDVRACDAHLERVRLIYGKEFAENLIEFTEELPDLKMYGLLGKPEFTKPTREYQLFFLNQRPIRSHIISAALTEALNSMIAKDRQPVAFLFLTLDPEAVDVNVHPAKIEVRFRNERTIYSGIVRMLRNAIHKAKYIPKIETPVESSQSEGDTDTRDTSLSQRVFHTTPHTGGPAPGVAIAMSVWVILGTGNAQRLSHKRHLFHHFRQKTTARKPKLPTCRKCKPQSHLLALLFNHRSSRFPKVSISVYSILRMFNSRQISLKPISSQRRETKSFSSTSTSPPSASFMNASSTRCKPMGFLCKGCYCQSL